MRKWRSPEDHADQEGAVNHQIVVPKSYKSEILSLAHHKILNHYYRPGFKADVSNYCRSCRTCQMVGKPYQVIPIARLQPVSAFDEPFSRIIMACVGLLPKIKNGLLCVLRHVFMQQSL